MNVAARVAAAAQPGEVLVSSTVKDLVAGSGIAFSDRGLHALKGIPDKWRLWAVTTLTAHAGVGSSTTIARVRFCCS